MKSTNTIIGTLALLMGCMLCACSSHRNVAAAQPASVSSTSPPTPSDVPLAGKDGYTLPKCVHCPEPKYSDEAFQARIQGEIVMSVVIGTDGRAHNIHLVRSLGHGLDEQAILAARDVWRFTPANGPNGKPAAVRMLVEIDFHLH